METKSFTLRMPADLLTAIEEQSGKGKRSEFIIGVLRKALGLSTEEKTPGLDLAARIDELSFGLEAFKTEQDKILQRLTALEDNKPEELFDRLREELALQSKTGSKTKNEEIEVVLQGNTNSKTEEDETVLQSKTESNATEKDEVQLSDMLPISVDEPEGELVTSAELLEILRAEEPKRNWNGSVLANYRKGNSATTWRTIGRCRFVYAKDKERQQGGSGRPQHMWYVNRSIY